MSESIVQKLLLFASICPKKIAIVWPSGSITYGELAMKVSAAANTLEFLGFGRGDRIVLSASSNQSFMALLKKIAVDSEDPAHKGTTGVIWHLNELRRSCY